MSFAKPRPPGAATRTLLLAAIGAFAAFAALAHAQGVAGSKYVRPSGLLPIDQAYRLTTDVSAPGVIKLHWMIAPHYYLYRGQMGFTSGDGLTLGAAQLPDGIRHHDQYLGEVEIYHNSIDASIPYVLAPDTKRIRFSVRYQGCHEVTPKLCYPPHVKQFDLPVPRAAATGAAGGINSGQPIRGGRGSGASVSIGAAAKQVTGSSATVSQRSGAGLAVALALAFAGGLILNLAPCVLPVLAIKAVGLLESGEDPARRHRHALAYTAGVLFSFAAIGIAIVVLRSAGHALGWGAQLQQPLIVGVLVCLMVAVGLSMSGMVHFGTSLGNVGHGMASRSGWPGDFFTGVLAVVVSSPCVAPFMGTALAYAFLAPTLAALLVFLALGVGLALPFLMIGFVPVLGRLLPRPGAWMETLKHVLAFPMYLTAVWLVWVLAHQRGADAVGLVLTAVVLLAMALWWFERSRHRGMPARALTAVLALMAAAPLYFVARLQPVSAAAAVVSPGKDDVAKFSPERLAELRNAGTVVFVDMTADWCINCKANEHVVLDTPAFRALLRRTGAVYMVGDWTDVNPSIGAFLQEYHSPGVPLYVVFPKGGGAGTVLPSVLSMSLVRNALETASRPTKALPPSGATANPDGEEARVKARKPMEASSPRSAATKSLDRAEALAKAQKPMEALRAFIAAIDADPDNLQAHEALLDFQSGIYGRKNYKEIRSSLNEQYAEWARRYPDSTVVLFSAGMFLSMGENPAARQYLLSYLKRDSDEAHAQLHARAYDKLAEDATRRGEDNAARDYWRKASSLAPRDEGYAISYAMAQNSEVPLLEVVRRFPVSYDGADALLDAAEDAFDDATRIDLLERERKKFPSVKFTASEDAASELYTAYLRVDPAKAVELARQQMQAVPQKQAVPDDGSSWDWPKLEKQAKAYVETLHLVDVGHAGQALGLLDALPPVDSSDLGDKIARLDARVLVGAHETKKAYGLLLHQQALWPDDATGSALRRTGSLLHKTTQQVTADLNVLRYAHAETAPLFDLEEYGSDQHVSLEDLRGKVVLVSFWFPGCPPCREELPGLQATLKYFSPKDIVFLGINGMRDQDSYVLPFVTNKKYSLIPLKSTRKVLGDYKVDGFPSNFLVDRTGRIVYSHFQIEGAHDEDQLRSMIESLLSRSR